MALPAGTTVINGFALTPDGALFVTTDPASAITGTTITATTKFLAADGTAVAPGYAFTTSPDDGMFLPGNNQPWIASGGGIQFGVESSGGMAVVSTGAIGFLPAADPLAVADAIFRRDAAGVIAQRNGTNSQASRVYHTYTDGSNYQAAQIAQDATNIYFQAITAGTGGDDINVSILPAGLGNVVLSGATAPPAAGSATARVVIGSTAGFGVYFGSGAPTVSAAKGSIYLRTDGSSIATRMYVNTDAGTTWTNVVTAA